MAIELQAQTDRELVPVQQAPEPLRDPSSQLSLVARPMPCEYQFHSFFARPHRHSTVKTNAGYGHANTARYAAKVCKRPLLTIVLSMRCTCVIISMTGTLGAASCTIFNAVGKPERIANGSKFKRHRPGRLLKDILQVRDIRHRRSILFQRIVAGISCDTDNGQIAAHVTKRDSARGF